MTGSDKTKAGGESGANENSHTKGLTVLLAAIDILSYVMPFVPVFIFGMELA